MHMASDVPKQERVVFCVDSCTPSPMLKILFKKNHLVTPPFSLHTLLMNCFYKMNTASSRKIRLNRVSCDQFLAQ